MQKINTASIILTEDCNMACSFCYERDKTPAVMTKAVVKNTVDFLAAHRNPDRLFLMWFGGEPLINFCALKAGIEYAKLIMPDNLAHLIPTNGTIWTDEIERFINSNPEITIQVSWQGIPELQKTSRGFEVLVESNIRKILNSTSNPFRIQIQILPYMVYKLADTIDYIADIIGNRGKIIIRPIPEAEGWLKDNMLDLLEQQIKISCFKHGNVLKKVCDAEAGLTSDITYCGAGKNFCTITPIGDIYPCHRLYFQRNASLKLGNIKSGFLRSNIADILDTCSRDSMIGCANCSARDYCYLCPACNYESTGNFFTPTFQNCAVNQAFVSGLRSFTSQIQHSPEPIHIVREPNINIEDALYQMTAALVNLNESVASLSGRVQRIEDQIKFIGRM